MVLNARDGGKFMKSILLSGTAAILLLSAFGAFAAQPDDQHHPDAGAADTHTSGDQHGTMGADHNNKPATTTTTRHTRTRRTTTTHTTTTPGNDNNGHNDAMHGDNNMHGASNAHHAQIDVKLRIAVTATHHFNAGVYRAPPGYAYRRYNIGERLEPAFYARDYWLADYATYQLVAPPDGYTWVRFGPDAMLIDEDTGEVVQVQYGIFS
jgi:Ni/Co efflux regulator RcnB